MGEWSIMWVTARTGVGSFVPRDLIAANGLVAERGRVVADEDVEDVEEPEGDRTHSRESTDWSVARKVVEGIGAGAGVMVMV